MNKTKNIGRDILFGISIGDAMGVPLEFISREELSQNPVADMRAFGTFNQPKGTWSDDSSLTFCLAESLLNGFNLKDIATKMIQFKDDAYWTAHNEVFDIGITTTLGIDVLEDIIAKKEYHLLEKLGNMEDELTNGNGALMRILPIICYVKNKPILQQFEIIWQVSALTHYHIRSAIACLIYIKFAENLINGLSKEIAYNNMQNEIHSFFIEYATPLEEQQVFDRLIQNQIVNCPIEEIRSAGYVLDSLEASIWCLMNTNSYKDAVLKAANLGHDSDTIASIVGGLAGILYGYESIPNEWMQELARKDEILMLADQLNSIYK
jgi:ADP-ribosyl-[dinitrogen reductase] hydrolase